jgi:hypothetical protein
MQLDSSKQLSQNIMFIAKFCIKILKHQKRKITDDQLSTGLFIGRFIVWFLFW